MKQRDFSNSVCNLRLRSEHQKLDAVRFGKEILNLRKRIHQSLVALAATALAVASASTPLCAQAVPGIALDPPVVSNPGPAQPGQLQGTVTAPQLTTAEKFEYRIVQSFGLRNFIGAAIGASIGQADKSPKEWGQDVPGFAQRYASSFAGTFSRQAFAFTLETVLREDPRYFPLSSGSAFKIRVLNATKQVVWTKNDDGSSGVAYARLISTFGAAEFTNVWQPPSTSTQWSAVRRGCIGLAADFGYNFLQEFFPFARPISLRHRH